MILMPVVLQDTQILKPSIPFNYLFITALEFWTDIQISCNLTEVLNLKKLCCFIAIAMLICALPVRADALTKGQKSIGDIGVRITWFDFGKAYKDYHIRDNMGTDFYTLTMSNDSTVAAKTGFVNEKGELV